MVFRIYSSYAIIENSIEYCIISSPDFLKLIAMEKACAIIMIHFLVLGLLPDTYLVLEILFHSTICLYELKNWGSFILLSFLGI